MATDHLARITLAPGLLCYSQVNNSLLDKHRRQRPSLLSELAAFGARFFRGVGKTLSRSSYKIKKEIHEQQFLEHEIQFFVPV